MDKENPLVDIERLHFILGVKPRFQDPLCGLGEQLIRLADLNVIEEIMLEPCVHADAPRIVSAGRLDAVLAHEFPILRRVSVNIGIGCCRDTKAGDRLALQENLNKVFPNTFQGYPKIPYSNLDTISL